jgi:AcrR family transcriptional regulator
VERAEHAEEKARTPAAEKLLRVASELFYGEGIRAIGVDTIVERSGVAKMTLYKNFGSKDELVVAYLRARDERWRAWLEDEVERRADSPRERIPAVFDALEKWMEGDEGFRGCAFVNASTEIADSSHPAYAVISEHKRWMLRYFEGLAEAAGDEAPEELAERLLILYEGANIARTMRIGREPIVRARETAEALIR